MKTKILIWIVAFVLLVGSVQAMGVAPARTKQFFEPNLNQDYVLTVLNNNNEERKVEFTVSGELAHYITIEDSIIIDANAEKEIKFNLDLPETLKPGPHTANIMIAGIKPTAAPGETSVGAYTSVVTKVLVVVPYPGKYLEAELKTDPVPERATINFRIELDNLGKENLNKIDGRIQIYDGETLTDELKTDSISLNSKDSGKITAMLGQGLLSGKYKAVAFVDYDGKQLTDEKEFEVDKPLHIFGLTGNVFEIGEIAKLQLEIENRWEEAGMVYSDIEIWDSMGNKIKKLKTSSTDINPLSKTVLEGFWNTAGLEPGNYQLKFTTHIFGVRMDSVFAVELIEKRPIEYANMTALIVIIIILLIAIAIFNIYRLRHNNTKK